MKNFIKLYWVSTADHGADWFILAFNKRDAERYHEDKDDYDSGMARAELICILPEDQRDEYELKENNQRACYPSTETIKACGGKFLRNERELFHIENANEDVPMHNARVVQIRNKIFAEGMLMERMCKEHNNVPFFLN